MKATHANFPFIVLQKYVLMGCAQEIQNVIQVALFIHLLFVQEYPALNQHNVNGILVLVGYAQIKGIAHRLNQVKNHIVRVLFVYQVMIV